MQRCSKSSKVHSEVFKMDNYPIGTSGVSQEDLDRGNFRFSETENSLSPTFISKRFSSDILPSTATGYYFITAIFTEPDGTKHKDSTGAYLS
jgi:hypothetical protein